MYQLVVELCLKQIVEYFGLLEQFGLFEEQLEHKLELLFE